MSSLDLDQRFKTARQNHASGEDAIAETGYRDVLREDPNHCEALFGLGVIELRSNRFTDALEALRRAARVRPNWPEAHNAMGSALMSLKRFDEAIQCFRTASLLAPKRAMFLNNLGLAHIENRESEKAIAVYRRSIEINAKDPLVHHNLARALGKLGKIDEAILAYGRAIILNRDFAAAYLGLGAMLMKRNRAAEALAAAKKACELEPTLAEAHSLRAYALGTLGRREEATAAYSECLRLEPDNPKYQLNYGAYSGDPSIRTTPAAVVRSLFDEYAPTFDNHLVQTLSYQTPKILFDAFRASDMRSDLNVLDLGCGTGLCGIHFRPVARRLVGIDLSPEMLRVADERDLYDELVEADVTDWLQRQSARFDVIVSADVFVYVGDLDAVFSAVFDKLSPRGLFIFSVEKADGDGFVLHTTCRFAHSLKYLETLRDKYSFEEVSVLEVLLRRDNNADILGLAIVLRKGV